MCGDAKRANIDARNCNPADPKTLLRWRWSYGVHHYMSTAHVIQVRDKPLCSLNISRLHNMSPLVTNETKHITT